MLYNLPKFLHNFHTTNKKQMNMKNKLSSIKNIGKGSIHRIGMRKISLLLYLQISIKSDQYQIIVIKKYILPYSPLVQNFVVNRAL